MEFAYQHSKDRTRGERSTRITRYIVDESNCRLYHCCCISRNSYPPYLRRTDSTSNTKLPFFSKKQPISRMCQQPQVVFGRPSLIVLRATIYGPGATGTPNLVMIGWKLPSCAVTSRIPESPTMPTSRTGPEGLLAAPAVTNPTLWKPMRPGNLPDCATVGGCQT